MPKKNTKLKSPSQINPFDTGKKSLRVVIETPKGSRNKFKYDDELGVYRLNSILSEGMVFPYDFGFVPQTQAADGDPIDVLLLMDEPAFSGCVVECRIVGVIEAEQSDDKNSKKMIRNDRILAVAVDSHEHADMKKPKDFGNDRVRELEKFFTAYNQARGKKFKILGTKGSATAMKLIKKSRLKG